MRIKRVVTAYFSPTGTTAGVCKRLADDIAVALGVTVVYIDFTLPKNRLKTYSFNKDEIVVFGVPTYAGRVPNKILQYIQESFIGDRTLAVPIVTFGNRSFDSSLAELKKELCKNSFSPMASCAVCARHAFTDKIGTGRPDSSDFKKIDDFTTQVINRLNDITDEIRLANIQSGLAEKIADYYKPLDENGNVAKFLRAIPKTDGNKCTSCGKCAEVCPMGSIDFVDFSKVTGICIKCYACIRGCPESAKYFDDAAFLSHVRMLERDFRRRAESQFYIDTL